MRIERLLVIKIRALGDTLLATPSLRALRFGFPQAHLTALVSTAGAEVLKGNPDINELLVYDKSRAGVGYSLGLMRDLASRRFDAVVALHASFRTALLARATGAPVRVVHNHSGADYFSTVQIPARKESKSAIERDLDAVRALGLTRLDTQLTFVVTEPDRRRARDFIEREGLAGQPFIILIPEAGKPGKQWPAEHVAAFLKLAAERSKVRWVLLSGPGQDRVRRIAQSTSPRPPVFQGSIQAAGALMSLSLGVLTTDSGPKHVAVAVGAKTLTFWTREPEAEWHPYDLKRHALIRAASGNLADLRPEEVLEKAVEHFAIQ